MKGDDKNPFNGKYVNLVNMLNILKQTVNNCLIICTKK